MNPPELPYRGTPDARQEQAGEHHHPKHVRQEMAALAMAPNDDEAILRRVLAALTSEK